MKQDKVRVSVYPENVTEVFADYFDGDVRDEVPDMADVLHGRLFQDSPEIRVDLMDTEVLSVDVQSSSEFDEKDNRTYVWYDLTWDVDIDRLVKYNPRKVRFPEAGLEIVGLHTDVTLPAPAASE